MEETKTDRDLLIEIRTRPSSTSWRRRLITRGRLRSS